MLKLPDACLTYPKYSYPEFMVVYQFEKYGSLSAKRRAKEKCE